MAWRLRTGPAGGAELGLASVTAERRAQIIVLGNEKGGSGKSTAAMHLIVALLRDGYSVGAIDLDARQATLTDYLAARAAFARPSGIALPLPLHEAVPRSDADSRAAAEAEETDALRRRARPAVAAATSW